VEVVMSHSSEIDTLFSGISVTTTYPPHNALAVGPNHIVMLEGSRIEWTNLSGGQPVLQSVYNFFSSLNPTGGLYDPRVVYDPVSQRFIVIMQYGASGQTVSAINIAVSKDSDPNHGWYFASLNTSLTINNQLTSADRPMLSVDGTNIYITAAMYNVNVSGYAGTQSWVISTTAGAGGGLYNGGTMTVVASQLNPANQGIFTVVDGDNGKAYYASSYSNGSQIVVTLKAYDVATNTFGATSTIGLGKIDQGGSYTAQQLGTNLLLNAGDKRIANIVYANGFLYGVSELKPIGSSAPLVHWFKIDVSNPNAPFLVAQGDISGASIGVNVATFNASIAVNGVGDVLINFTASGPNMYPSDYYVFQGAGESTFSAPISYQASSGFFNSGDGASVQRWGLYSSAIADPNNPDSFWISNEYVANGWWQTSVAQIEIKPPGGTAPTVAAIAASGAGITNGSGNLNAGKVVTLTVSFSETVTVAGSPALALNDGGIATYAGGSGTSALAFSYTVAPGQNTPDLVVATLNLNGGTIQNGTGSNADLSGATNYNPAGTLRIDTTVPAAPTGLSLDPTTDGGTLGDGITKFVQVEIDGTAEPGSTVMLYDTNGITVIGTGTASAGTGAFSITTSTLSSGAHSITAKATDTAGNVGVASAAYAVTIDTAAPAQPIGLSLEVSTDSGALGDGITSFVQLEIDGTAEPGSTVTLYDTNGTTVIGTGTASAGNGAFSIITSTLSNGPHAITAKATDAAGNTGAASAAYSVTIEPPAGSFSEIDTLFSGISVTATYPPHNGLAVGPNHIVMVEGSRIEWTNLSGGSAALQSVYNFFSSLNPTGGLSNPRVVFDSVNQRFVVTMKYTASGGVSAVNIAVSKDADPNHGWYFASLNTALTINNQLTAADRPMLSVDGTNIYISAPMYNVNVSGYAGTQSWVISTTAGAGGGLYNGGTMTVVANQLKPPSQGVFAVVDGDNGKAYYASSYSNGNQIVVTLTTYDQATNTFGSTNTIGLGQIDQGGSYTAQQLGTNLLLNAGDKRVASLVYADGFLYGVSELKPIGSSVPLVHWFKIDVSNPNAPFLAAQGDISGASIGTNVATFNSSIAVNAVGDVLINFTASGPNMYPSDYYVFQAAGESTFSAPISYQASSGFFNSGNGASVQPWGLYSSAIADPNNPDSFWISNEYVANGWWQTSVAQIEIHPAAEAPAQMMIGSSSQASDFVADSTLAPTALLDQFMAAGFQRGQADVGTIAPAPPTHNGPDRMSFLTNPSH
jgi:hypothetical protein